MQVKALIFIGITGALVACGGGGGDSGGTPVTPQLSNGSLGLEANFNSIQTKLFSTTCAISGCHTGVGAPEGLDLSVGNSYALLVNIGSNQVPALKRVNPMDATNSYLIQKLEGTAAVGQRMPRGGSALTSGDIAAIRQWINNGALADGGAPDVKSLGFAVQATAPVNGAVVSQSLGQVVVVFTKPVDASGVYPESFSLQRSGGDGGFAEGNEVVIRPARVEVPQGNAQSVVLHVYPDDMMADDYRLTVHAGGNIPVQDLSASRLLTDYVSTFSKR